MQGPSTGVQKPDLHSWFVVGVVFVCKTIQLIQFNSAGTITLIGGVSIRREAWETSLNTATTFDFFPIDTSLHLNNNTCIMLRELLLLMPTLQNIEVIQFHLYQQVNC